MAGPRGSSGPAISGGHAGPRPTGGARGPSLPPCLSLCGIGPSDRCPREAGSLLTHTRAAPSALCAHCRSGRSGRVYVSELRRASPSELGTAPRVRRQPCAPRKALPRRAAGGHAEQGPVPPRGPTSSVLPPVAFANPRNRDRDGRPGSRHQSSLRGGSRSQPWAPVLTAPRPVFRAVPESRPVPRFCPQLSVWSLNSSFYGAEIFNFHKGQFVR